MRYIITTLLLLSTLLFAEVENRADCILLEDENSIICKYVSPRVDIDKTITIEWIDPNGEISRSRKMVVPPMHGSVYDYRYLQGRLQGVWTFKVIDDDKTYEAQFTIE